MASSQKDDPLRSFETVFPSQGRGRAAVAPSSSEGKDNYLFAREKRVCAPWRKSHLSKSFSEFLALPPETRPITRDQVKPCESSVKPAEQRSLHGVRTATPEFKTKETLRKCDDNLTNKQSSLSAEGSTTGFRMDATKAGLGTVAGSGTSQVGNTLSLQGRHPCYHNMPRGVLQDIDLRDTFPWRGRDGSWETTAAKMAEVVNERRKRCKSSAPRPPPPRRVTPATRSQHTEDSFAGKVQCDSPGSTYRSFKFAPSVQVKAPPRPPTVPPLDLSKLLGYR